MRALVLACTAVGNVTALHPLMPLAVWRTFAHALHGTRFNWIHSVAAIMALGQQAMARWRGGDNRVRYFKCGECVGD